VNFCNGPEVDYEANELSDSNRKLPISKRTSPTPLSHAAYNALPSLFWTVLGLMPISIFCYSLMERRWLYIFIAISLIAYAIPTSQFHHWQLSSKLDIYRKIGVRAAGKLAQNGSLVNKLIQRRYPGYRVLNNRSSITQIVRTTYHQERFHLAMFLFFLMAAIYAAVQSHVVWSLLLTFTNVIYNVYPIWLQQYTRLRLRSSRNARS